MGGNLLRTTDVTVSQRNLAPVLKKHVLEPEPAVQQATRPPADWDNSGGYRSTENVHTETTGRECPTMFQVQIKYLYHYSSKGLNRKNICDILHIGPEKEIRCEQLNMQRTRKVRGK